MKCLATMESIFKLTFKTKLLLLKPLSASVCLGLKVMISSNGVDISGYLIPNFTFWKKKSSIRDSPRLNSFALSWINCTWSSVKLQYWMYTLLALLKVKRFKLRGFYSNNLNFWFEYLALSGWIFHSGTGAVFNVKN